jgi:large subunit ribosomal protein L30
MATEKTTAEKPAKKAAAPKAAAPKAAAAKPAAAKAAPKAKAEAAQPAGTFRVTLVKSPIGTKHNHRASVAGLGLRKLNQTVEVADTPANRGMVNAARFLLKCEA